MDSAKRFKDANGRSALFHSRSADMVRVLNSAGCDVHARDKTGRTAAHSIISRRGSVEVVRAFMEAGGDVTVSDDVGTTPLHVAVCPDAVAEVVSRAGAACLECGDKEGRRPLHVACLRERDSVVTALLAAGADPNARDHLDRSPLHYVAERGGTASAKALLAAGARADAVDALGWNVLHCAAAGAWPQHESHPRVMKLVLADSNPPDPSHPDAQGQTPAHVATDQSAMDILIAAGADVGARDVNLCTPLHTARGYDVTSSLVDAGVVIQPLDRFGRTPLHLTTDPDKARILLGRGADANATDKSGFTPLDAAVQSERPEVAEVIVEFGGKRSVWLRRQLGKFPVAVLAAAGLALLAIAIRWWLLNTTAR